jgi:hypothetical protein
MAAHSAGLEDSVWRTDLGVLNPCDVEATVEIVLHSDAGGASETFVIAGGQQQIFEDVVAQLVDGEASGALELSSEVPVSVTSRTYNLGAEGTFGQAIDGVGAADGVATGDAVTLQQLRQDDSFRSNIGVLNMGAEELTVSVTLYDQLGAEVGSFDLEVPAGRTVQDNGPFLQRFQRSDIVGGYARLTVTDGSGAWAYASVVDDRTNDPTTVTPDVQPDCPVDIADALSAIEGMSAFESSTDVPGYRYFVILYEQPDDHNDPDSPTFRQFMTLLHRSEDAPMVLHTSGYYNSVGDNRIELTQMLNANQLSVEHRFFDSSTPLSRDWALLTIAQAAGDHHRIVEDMAPIYTGPWVSTGASKGGMTALFFRRFYPDDVDATVPYVAPISFAAPDERYVDFLATRGDAACRQALVDLQREALTRRQPMLDLLTAWANGIGLTFNRIGGIERGFESGVAELPFTFWQYWGETFCSALPDTGVSDQEIFDALNQFTEFWYATDYGMNYFDPYYYQAHDEFGYPDLDFSYLEDLLETEVLNLEEGLPPEGSNPTYDPAVMADIADWVSTEGSQLLFIYGENDPWTAGALELGEAEDSYAFTVAGGTHGSSISTLDAEDQQEVADILERWTGVAPTKSLGSPPPSGRARR